MSQISVLLPNYNNGLYLREALDSIFAQSFQDFEIIFVDDCSTDGSLDIAKSYKDKRLKIIEKEVNSGIVDTLNLGLSYVKSPFIIRMDGDDISTPDRFETLHKFMTEHPDIDVCSSDIEVFGIRDGILSYQRSPELNHAHLIFCHSLGHASSIFRTKILNDNNIFYKNDFWLMEDYNLFYDLKKIAKCTSIPKLLYRYRQGEYNNDPVVEQKKKDVFLNFYKMVLSDLQIEPSEEKLITHLQFSLREKPSFDFNHYRAHLSLIISQNKVVNIYPQKELEVIMNKFLNLLAFRLVDAKSISLLEIFSRKAFSKKLLLFYVKKRLKIGKSKVD